MNGYFFSSNSDLFNGLNVVLQQSALSVVILFIYQLNNVGLIMPLLIKRMECSIVYKHEMSLKRALLKVRRKHDPVWLFPVKLFVIVCKLNTIIN